MSEFGGLRKHKNTAHIEKTQLGSAVRWLLTFPWEKQPEFPVHCSGTRKLSYLMLSHTGPVTSLCSACEKQQMIVSRPSGTYPKTKQKQQLNSRTLKKEG